MTNHGAIWEMPAVQSLISGQAAHELAERERAKAAGLAPFTVTQDGQLCSGGREPVERGTRAYEDAGGWVWCPEHIPGPEPANG